MRKVSTDTFPYFLDQKLFRFSAGFIPQHCELPTGKFVRCHPRYPCKRELIAKVQSERIEVWVRLDNRQTPGELGSECCGPY